MLRNGPRDGVRQHVAMWVQILISGVAAGVFAMTVMAGTQAKSQMYASFAFGLAFNWLVVKLWVWARYGHAAAKTLTMRG